MLFLELKTLDDANNLCKICDRYKNKMNVDVAYGRYIIDGCSILAVSSMIGKIVKICPVSEDNLLVSYFAKDIKSMGGYEINNNIL